MADEAPPYNEVQGELLDPRLVFHADMFRGLYLTRNVAFAREIVEFIARQANTSDPPMLKNTTGRGYTYNEEGSLLWDKLIGYPAYQAFTTSQKRKILDLAKHDLETRGFQVYHLDFFQQNIPGKVKSCGKRAAIECKCQCHGIYVTWDLSCA